MEKWKKNKKLWKLLKKIPNKFLKKYSENFSRKVYKKVPGEIVWRISDKKTLGRIPDRSFVWNPKKGEIP